MRENRIATAAVVIALALPPAGAWLLWGDGTNPRVAALPVTLPDVEPRRPYRVVPPEPIVDLPGDRELDEQGLPEYFHALGVLSSTEFELVMSAGAARAQVLSSREGQLVRSITRYTARDGSRPEQMLREFDGFFATSGWEGSHRSGAHIWQSPTGDRTHAIRAMYIRGRDLIQVEVHGPNPDQVHSAAESLIDTQIDRFPADA